MGSINNRLKDYFFVLTSENCSVFKNHLSGYCVYNDQMYFSYSENLAEMTYSSVRKGMFALILRDNDSLRILRDEMGLMQLYCYQNGDYWALSNSFWMLCDEVKKSPLHLNVGYAEGLYAFGMTPYVVGETLCEEIEAISLFAEIEVDCNTSKLSIRTPDKLADKIPLDSREGMMRLDACISEWGTLARALANGGWDMNIHLSGGYDSRVSFAIAKHAGIDFHKDNITVYSVFPKTKGDMKHFAGDYETAKQICDTYKLPLVGDFAAINPGEKLNVRTRETIYRHTISNGVIQAFDRMYSYRRPVIIWSGHLGESIRGYRYGTESILSQSRIYRSGKTSQILANGCNSIMNSYEVLSDWTGEEPDTDANMVRHCMECLDEVFFGKQMQQFYLTNQIVLNQFMDISLRKLKVPKGISPMVIYAVILLRTCPELIEIPFNGEDSFSKDDLEYAKKLCVKYPSTVTIREDVNIPCENKFYSSSTNERNDSEDEWHDLNEYLYEQFNKEKTKDNLVRKMGGLGNSLYKWADDRYKTEDIFRPETYLSGVIAISNMLDIEHETTGDIKKIDTDTHEKLKALTIKYPDVPILSKYYNEYLDTHRMRKIYIYGAGHFGHLLYEWLINHTQYEVSGFVQSVRDQERPSYNGVSIYLPEEVDDEEAIFLIAIDNNDAVSEIRTRLEWLGHQSLDCAGFIRDNLLHKHNRFCNLCGQYADDFYSGGIDSKLFLEHHIIGGGQRKNCICPSCSGTDRTRWIYYVLHNYTRIFDEPCSVLHFAPEEKISEQIRKNVQCQYITADIRPGWTDLAIDMTDIPFRDGIFDYVIANHVLEHIEDEKQAISELLRVLKRDGRLIISFPICMDMDTYENNSIQSKEERLLHFGQEDHVRLYGADYKERLERYGMKIETYSPRDILTKSDIERFGFVSDDVVMICERRSRCGCTSLGKQSMTCRI